MTLPSIPHKQFNALKQRIRQCYGADRFRLGQRLRFLGRKFSAADLERLEGSIERSIQVRKQRLANLPQPEYPAELPVSGKREEILKSIRDNQVVILCGETGSGKTTQLPKICLELGRGVDGFIGHTQPRRLAARSVAARIGEELKSDQHVGYKIRFQDRTQPHSYIKLMTDGILLAEIQEDRYLNQYDTLIIDEAHERSLNIDFLLGYLKWLLPRRRDMKLIITSATIDPERFSLHFNNAPIIEVSGRTYPVEIRYRPLISDAEDEADRDMIQAIADATEELYRESMGDILVFLSGEREIRETANFLRKQNYTHTEILPLYSRLSNAEQNKIFRGHRGRRIVLSTNVAETSLTVPGIKYVIDTGVARISRYSWRARVQRLPIEKISQASALQRSGRCGRTSDGIAIRLYSEEDFESRPEFTEPEITRTNLASVILQMTIMRLGDIEKFPFVETPDSRLIRDGFKLLFELNAVDKRHKLTPIGRQLARLPIDPRLARMLVAAEHLGALKEVLIIVSALSIQDPRERPLEKQQAADEKHSRFKSETSDFLSYLKLWAYYHEQREALSQNRLRKLCHKEYLSYIRLREWSDIYRQIHSSIDTRRINKKDADEDSIHRSLLTGLLGQLGSKDEDSFYLGSHNRKFMIFPGSGLRKKQPKWVMSAEMVETSRLFARTVAKIQPQWIEEAARHLIKPHYSEPHWEQRPAQVAAFVRLTLYGITINPKKRINFGKIDPVTSRQIFIRHALVYAEYHCKAPFFQHNQKLIENIETLEAKSRRRDILVDEETLYDFYEQRIPENIYSGHAFEKWRKKAEADNPEILFLTREYLLQRDTAHVQSDLYPDHLSFEGYTLPLHYHFDPGHKRDGVTVQIPHILLGQVSSEPFEYLVPGMLEEKITALIRSLPKQVRKQFVPAPEYAKACMQAIKEPQNIPLIQAVSQQFQRMTGNSIPRELWDSLRMPEHLQMRFEIIDSKHKIIKAGRNLTQLKGDIKHKTQQSFEKLPNQSIERQGITKWDFGKLPDDVSLNSGGISIRAYPALLDKRDSVAIKLFDSAEKAQQKHLNGLLRLLILSNTTAYKQLRKNLPDIQKLCLYYNTTGKCEELKDSILRAGFRQTYLHDTPNIRSEDAFNTRLQTAAGQLTENTHDLCRVLQPILKTHHDIRKQLKGSIKPNWLEALNDINDQLNHLIYPGFLDHLQMKELRQLPRYLKAIARRLDKLSDNPQRDRSLRIQVQPHWDQYKEAIKKQPKNREKLQDYRWMIEEFRVSLFAQELGTAKPVSARRLEKFWQEKQHS
jgi:ATP-dependent helicase HrpA